MVNSEYFDALKSLTDILEKYSVQYMITGGLSQNVYLEARLVQDIDIVIAIKKNCIDELLNGLSDSFEFRKVDRKIEHEGMFNMTHIKTRKKVDVILKKTTDFNELEFQNKTIKNILGLELNCVTIGDLIIAKLNWIQDFQPEKQIDDLERLVCSPDLDWDYINYWCNRLGLNTYGVLKKQV